MINSSIISAVLILCIIDSVSAQSVSEKRSFIKSMHCFSDTKLEVDNEYGDIHITTWNKDSVYIMAEIEAFAPTHAKLDKMFEGININMTGTSFLIRAKTEFDQSITELLQGIKGLTDKIITYNSKVKINYFINAPDNIDISIDNQFGDIFMETNKKSVTASLSNGSFSANSLNRLTSLTISFGSVEIGSVKTAGLKPTFSQLVIGESDDLSVNSTSSRFNINRTGRIKAESRRDKFFIGTINDLEGESYFSDYKIEDLEKEATITLKYGSIDVTRIENQLDKIDISAVNSDITLSCIPSLSYNFEIRHTNSFVVIPEKNTKSDKQVLNEDRNESIISGTVGNNPGLRKIAIEATKGNIYLR
jgi:hypothetical protein